MGGWMDEWMNGWMDCGLWPFQMYVNHIELMEG